MTTRRGTPHAAAHGRLLRYGKLSFSAALGLALLSGFAALLAGCASPPPRHAIARIPPPPGVSTGVYFYPRVYFYPKAGQSAAQQDRDHFECYHWAVKQTGLDPNRAPPNPSLAPVEIGPAPVPGEHTAVGAVTGAVIGAAVAPRHEAGAGAVVGAVAGAAIGAASDAARQEQAARLQEQLERQQAAQGVAYTERQAQDFRRALGACLEGRGYSVR